MSFLTEIIKGALPMLGTALMGPFGGMAADFIGSKLGISNSSIDNIKNILSGMPPEKIEELKVHEQEFQIKMAELGYDSVYKLEELNTRSVEAINKTMQAEAASEHWPTYSWRPAIGFAVAFNLISSSLVIFIAYMWKTDLVAQVPAMLTAQAGLNAVAMPILGIASYFRGKAQADPSIPTNNKG